MGVNRLPTQITDDVSSWLVEELPDPARAYVSDFRTRHSLPELFDYWHRFKALRVLVVGEPIIDHYCYCAMLGPSADGEAAQAVRVVREERFAGGSVAIANHVAGFCNAVGLLGVLGDEPSHERFVREHLADNVEPILPEKRNAPTVLKRRFIEQGSGRRLFGQYVMDDRALDEAEEEAVAGALRELLSDYDVTLVADYGHGMISDRIVRQLTEDARFFALNVQANAGNGGRETVSRYPRADYICLSEREYRIDPHGRGRPPAAALQAVAFGLDCPVATLTRGADGNLAYDAACGVVTAPALGSRVVDPVGAGDAVLAVTSLYAACGASAEVIGFVGSAVGRQAVLTVCNRAPVSPARLRDFLATTLLSSTPEGCTVNG